MMPEDIKLSVVICTRNRSNVLPGTLDCVCTELNGISDVELIIVDNASSDNTQKIIESYISKYSFIKCIYCKSIGISKARNDAILHSTRDIIAFIDDDAHVIPGWYDELINAFSDLSVDCVGGRVLLKWEVERPDWFPDELEYYLAPYDRGLTPFFIKDQHLPVGANMAFRADVFKKYGGFDIRLGYSEKTKVGWEDIEMCNRILKNNGKILYAPDVVVEHLVGKYKISGKYIRKRMFAEGYGYMFYEYISNHPSKIKIKSDLKKISGDIYNALLFHTKYFLKHFKFEYKYCMDTLRRIGMYCGALWWWRESKKYSDSIWENRSQLRMNYVPDILQNRD